jgi:hypothetical protein
MIHTVFYETADARFVEYNNRTGVVRGMLTKEQLPIDVEPIDMTLGAYKAHAFAASEHTRCTGKAFGSPSLRTLNNKFVNPDLELP